MVARVLAFDRRILRFCKSKDAKADRAIRVVIILSGSQEIRQCVGEFQEPLPARGGVRQPLEVGFLGFGRDMPWNTSALLVSSSEGLMCIDLKEGMGTVVDLCCECENLVCCVEMFV